MIRPGEEFPSPEACYRQFVSYGETDAMGVVYYGNYPHWFERARGLFLRERGLSYAEVERRGFMLPVREMHVRYLAPARYDEEIMVRAGISSWGRASVEFVYQVYGPPDCTRPLCLGTTLHACVDAGGRPTAIPAWLKELCQTSG